jgi:hypothetical protein
MSNSKNQIPGQIFSPCYMSEADFERGYRESIFFVEGDYLEEYRKHMVAMEHIANMAKSYILNNWQKIEDWSDLELVITHGPTGEETEYFKYVPRDPSRKFHSKTWEEMENRIDEADRERHNPIEVINEVVLDPSDGDFSITINEKPHWWIADEEVIVIANYIEEKLKNK